MDQEFLNLLAQLSPALAQNKACVKYVCEYNGNLAVLFDTFMSGMGRASLNGRVRYLNFLEYCFGIVGQLKTPQAWRDLVSTNLLRVVDAAIPVHFAPPVLSNVAPTCAFVRRLDNIGAVDKRTTDNVLEQLKSKEATLKLVGPSRRYRVSKDDVLKRMKEDCERWRRYKDAELSVVTGSDAEFDRLWENESWEDESSLGEEAESLAP